MEYSNNEEVETLIFPQESNHSSADAENAEDKNDLVSEKNESSSGVEMPNINSRTVDNITEENATDIEFEHGNVSQEEPSLVETTHSIESLHETRDSNKETEEHPEITTEDTVSISDIQTTEDIQEIASESNNKSNKIDEYVEYEEENNSESVFVTQGVNVDSTEKVYSSGVSDAHQQNITLNESTPQNSTSEANITEDSWTTDYPSEQQSINEELSQAESAKNGDEIDSVKEEFIKVNEVTDVSDEAMQPSDINIETNQVTDENNEASQGTDINDESNQISDTNDEANRIIDINDETNRITDINDETNEVSDTNVEVIQESGIIESNQITDVNNGNDQVTDIIETNEVTNVNDVNIVNQEVSDVRNEDCVVETTKSEALDSVTDAASSNVKEEMPYVKVDDSVINNITDEQVENSTDSTIQEEIVNSNNENIENLLRTVVTAYNTITGAMEVTEIQEGEYTVIESTDSMDGTTHQLGDSENSDGTLILLETSEDTKDDGIDTAISEQNEPYSSEATSQPESQQSVSSQSSQTSENKPRRGRKSTYEIPMHVLGHDISKPVESVANGRTLPKPRLGVKVPYRNLTSQIVSKAEIEREVMERARLKQEQANSKGDILFARKLTQRLARKIAPTSESSKKGAESKKNKAPTAQVQQKEQESKTSEGKEIENHETQDNSIIHNDSDLLAILEGDGDELPVLPKDVTKEQVEETNLKMLEREIALQQLQDLPNQAPKVGVYRSHQIHFDYNASIPSPDASKSPKIKVANKTDGKVAKENLEKNQNSKDDQAHILSDKENDSAKQAVLDVHSATSKVISPKRPTVDVEPQVKVNMVLKTYSRKRKTTELPDATNESPCPKKLSMSDSDVKHEKTDIVIPSNVYVTKSSRIIKKKVIWDPDETPSRSPKAVIKSDGQSPKSSVVKTLKTVEKTTNSEKLSDKLTKDKVADKKVNEKVLKKIVPVAVEKKVGESPKIKTPIKTKKSRSEVDKLLMDEGAVKMLYDLKNNDEMSLRKKKDVYSVEKAHKEIIKKANEIKSDLQQSSSNESPKSLRKKENLTPPAKPAQIMGTERKMSKDSTRSSLHTPPGSPAYSFSHTQGSLLVRRRSSSSISSGDEVDENDPSKTQRKKSLTSSTDTPKPKKMKKSESNEEPVEQPTEVKVLPENAVTTENKSSPYKTFTIKKVNKHVTIDLKYPDEKCLCTFQVLEELTTALKKLAKEKDCNVVSVTSSSEAFCLGLDYSFLISDKEDVRKENATALAEKVRDFLLSLLKFPKILIAGIQGDCVGLGVTMLPLFDMVIASDVATFSTQYASLGSVAEAGFLLSPPIFTNHGLAAELLYSTQKLTADDAFRRGLVSRLCWPEKYSETLKTIVTSVAKGSKQSLEATKKQLQAHLVSTIEAAINGHSKELIEYWLSAECQKNFCQLAESIK